MPAKKGKAALICISDVMHDDKIVLHHGQEITAEVEKDAPDGLLDDLYDSGVVVEQALLPDNWKGRPEGNTDTVGFRVPDLSELQAAIHAKEARQRETGQVEEITKS